MIRLALAATLSSVYGIYNGYELCEATPVPGKEEYLNSEKYDYKVWDWDRPGNIKDFITKINAIRRDNPALHELDNLRFYPADDDNILFYGKMTTDRSNMVFIVVNLDPFDPHVAELEFPLEAMGLKQGDTFQVEELLDRPQAPVALGQAGGEARARGQPGRNLPHRHLGEGRLPQPVLLSRRVHTLPVMRRQQASSRAVGCPHR